MCEQDTLVEAIEVASPVLARRVGGVCGGHVQQPRRVRRVVESVTRYLLRMTTRATPFGLFAGVAPVRIGPTASVRWVNSTTPWRALMPPGSRS